MTFQTKHNVGCLHLLANLLPIPRHADNNTSHQQKCSSSRLPHRQNCFYQHKIFLLDQFSPINKSHYQAIRENYCKNPAAMLITSFTSQHHSGTFEWNVFTGGVRNPTHCTRHSLDTSNIHCSQSLSFW